VKNFKKLFVVMFMLAILPYESFAQLDSDSAVVRMSVAKFARISGLDDFVLYPVSTDGDADSIYSGSEDFMLESNCAVLVTLTGEQLTNGSSELDTSYNLDSAGMSFETIPGVHNQEHTVNAQAQLGQISEQEAGDYAANIEITVSAL
jgi:hypothetical protein